MPDPPVTYDKIDITLTHPKNMTTATATAILLSMRGPFKKTRSMERDCPGLGTIVHLLGPASRLYSARVRIESTSFTGCEVLKDKWADLDGNIGEVTITPRTDSPGSTHTRTSYTGTGKLTNIKFDVGEIPDIVSSSAICAVEFEVQMKHLTPVGLPS